MATSRKVLVFLEDGRKKILSLPTTKTESDVEFLTATIKKEFKLSLTDSIVIQQFQHGWIDDYMDVEDDAIIANQFLPGDGASLSAGERILIGLQLGLEPSPHAHSHLSSNEYK